jgi:proteasome assembly chaperone (PAC2) family protein
MELFSWQRRPAELRAPALVMAFRGWNDAGEAASTAASFLLGCGTSERFATAEAEELFDYQQTRPRVRIEEGGTRRIEWPRLELHAVHAPRAPRDLVVLLGPEPSLRWQTLADQVVEVADRLGVRLVVSLGSLLAEVPHSRPVPISALGSDPALLERLGLTGSNYEGPTGIVGVLHAAFVRACFPTVSLWASVPHYVAAAPNPKAALALVRRCEQLLGVAVDGTSLERASEDYERQLERAVQSDPEIRAFVEKLEETVAAEDQLDLGEIPSGEVIAREFQRFLRQRGEDKN